MKNLKKLVSVIVTLSMLISSLAAVSVSAEYGDIDSTNSHYKAVKVLSGLGIVNGDDEGNFNPASDIKRSEMVALICRAMGEESVAQSAGGSTFADVSADHWAAGYIAWGVAGNIVNGVGDNKFDPDASVKFQDAVVMILRALGYERIAQRSENGGYPTGYLKVASQKGLLASANFDGAKAATREVIAQLIYNALTTPLVDVSYYAANPADDEYTIYDGKNNNDLRTLLTYTNEIYKVKASVENTANTDESLRKDVDNPLVELKLIDAYDYAWKNVLDGTYKANGTLKAYVGATDVSDYLGYTVEAYVAENDNDDWELLAVVVDSKSIDSETITENFEAYNATTGVFEYYESLDDAKTTKIDVDVANLVVYYNGAIISSSEITSEFGSLSNLLVNVADSLTFMGPRNEDYTKIFVTDYAYKQVESVKASESYVKFTSGGLDLDAENRGNDKFIYNLYDAEGNAITLADVKEDDIFNIVYPKHKGDLDNVDVMDIYVTDTTVTGTVDSEITANYKYTIDGEEYIIDTNASLKVGDEGIFYITIDGKVFDADAASVTSKNYSFIVAGDKNTSFRTTTYKLRLFTGEGELETYTVAATVKVFDSSATNKNGKQMKRSDGTQVAYFDALIAGALADKTNIDAAKAALKDRIVTYKTNSSNEITELRFAGSTDFNVTANGAAKYIEDTKVFGNWDLNDNSKLFVAPVTEVSTGKYNVDEDDLEIATFASLDEDKVGGYDAVLYHFDRDDYLGAALVKEEISAALKKSHLAVVKTSSQGLDADGSDVTKYTFVQSGETKTMAVDYDKASTVAAMSTGDVFRYAANADNEITKTNLIFDVSTKAFDADIYTYADLDTNDVAIVYGKVTEIKSNKMTVDTTETGSTLQLRMNETDGNTYAYVDGAKLAGSNASAAVKSLSSKDGIKESYGTNDYYVVAMIGETSRYEDIVEFYAI